MAVSAVASLVACTEGGGRPTDAARDAGTEPIAQDGGRPSLVLAGSGDWAAYPASDDPLRNHQPKALDCGVAGVYREGDALEVDTGYCNYVLVSTPAVLAVSRGDRVTATLRHFDLTAPEPARAHVAILFDRDVQWQTTIEIPGQAAVHELSFAATRDLAAGEPIRLHLHNHGQNSWALSDLRTRD